jgi:hypothetical protein
MLKICHCNYKNNEDVEVTYNNCINEIKKLYPKIREYINMKNEFSSIKNNIDNIDSLTDEMCQELYPKIELHIQMKEDIKEHFSQVNQLHEHYVISYDRQLQLMQSLTKQRSQKARMRREMTGEKMRKIKDFENIKKEISKLLK